MLDPYLNLVSKQNNKVTPATFKKGVISAVHTNSNTADVLVVGNNDTTLKNIPVSSVIILSVADVGKRCRIDMFDETNPNDCVIAYLY